MLNDCDQGTCNCCSRCNGYGFYFRREEKIICPACCGSGKGDPVSVKAENPMLPGLKFWIAAAEKYKDERDTLQTQLKQREGEIGAIAAEIKRRAKDKHSALAEELGYYGAKVAPFEEWFKGSWPELIDLQTTAQAYHNGIVDKCQDAIDSYFSTFPNSTWDDDHKTDIISALEALKQKGGE